MLAGCVAVAYAFSATFLRQESATPRNIDVPQFGSQPGGSGTGSPLMRRSTTTAISAVERVVPRRTQQGPSGRAGRVSTPATRPEAGGSRRLQEAEARMEQDRSQETVTRQVGERPSAVTVNRRASEEESAAANERPSSGTRQGAGTVAPRNQPAQPDNTAEAQKRNERRSTPPPGTRSSLMGRRPQ